MDPEYNYRYTRILIMQLHVSYDVTDMEQRRHVNVQLENCINYLQSWMVTNKQILNGSKTEWIVLASSHFSRHSSEFQLKIDKNLVFPNVSSKHLGIFVDQYLSLKANVTIPPRRLAFIYGALGV